ncbi:hypothetical protein K439DRAFT_599578 [Ramaria rubella]|nr:hypothetical protein K439DRAFT_599578 [Ramaria rubella]
MHFVALKLTSDHEGHHNEVQVYSAAGGIDPQTRDIPFMHMRLNPNGVRRSDAPSLLWRSLVLECMGPDLERLRLMRPDLVFTPKMTLAVAIQTVRIYERLHACGWLHCNAKPGNFVIGPDVQGKNMRLYMIDFEWSQKIQPKPTLDAACVGWNLQFKPASWRMKLSETC